MRNLIRIIEDGVPSVGSLKWRQQALMYAMDHDDARFSPLSPEDTGLTKSVYISQSPEYPVFILDDREGFNAFPSDTSHVIMIGDAFGTEQEKQWAMDNEEILRAHCMQEIDTGDFIHAQKKAQTSLFEMANFNRGKFGAPLAFFVRPDGKGTRHDYRIKVNSNYQLKFDQTACFSIALRPDVHVVEGHSTGVVKKSDIADMLEWVRLKRDVFIEYIEREIKTSDELIKRLEDSNETT